jgi:O-antigen ligase
LDRADVVQLVYRWLWITAAGLALLAMVRAATEGFGDADLLVDDGGGQRVTSRILVSAQAAVVALAFLAVTWRWTRTWRPRDGLAAGAFLLVVVVAQHRSVWLATLAGVVVLAVCSSARRAVTAVIVAAWLAATFVPIVALARVDVSAMTEPLATSFQSASLETGTGADRAQTAQVLIAQLIESGPVATTFGNTYGSGWDRALFGRLQTYQPHNAYVQTALRAGAVGLACVVAILGVMLVRSYRDRREHGWIAAGVALFGVFSVAYAFPFEFAPLLAVAILWPDRDGHLGTSKWRESVWPRELDDSRSGRDRRIDDRGVRRGR